MSESIYWIPDKIEGWSLYTDDGSIPPNAMEADVSHNNRDIVSCGNLANLKHLNEASILHSLRQRYHLQEIYTFTNEVLVAINPYRQLDIYKLDKIDQYLTPNPQTKPPHIYSLTGTAFQTVQRYHRPQSILVNGESGSGKTETTKYIMKFLSELSSTSSTQVETVFLESNPILEAFGNAKTMRNLNSSRFGKYATVYYQGNQITGVHLQTYLLEKVRLIHRNSGEANFHIMYQLLNSELVEKHPFVEMFRSILNVPDDNKDYCLQPTQHAMEQMALGQDNIQTIFTTVLGLLVFSQIGKDSVNQNQVNQVIDEFLGLEISLVKRCLEYRQLRTGHDTIQIEIPAKEQNNLRDTLIKTIYGSVFSWIVRQINNKISTDPSSIGLDDGKLTGDAINILDIFGFEVFQYNSFEQLCINYTNEQLQHLFNERMIEMQQVEYQEEGLDWDPIDYQGNESCLVSLERNLFPLMDEESRRENGVDTNFIGRVKRLCLTEDSCYVTFPKQDPPPFFTVRHFASEVQYTLGEFTAKNADRVHPNIIELIQNSKNSFVKNLITYIPKQPTSTLAFKSVSSQFRGDLGNLLQTLRNSDIHYVRCLKPNDTDQSDNLKPLRLLEQLKYSGVIEAVRVSRLGFPVRFLHDDFDQTYAPIKSHIVINNSTIIRGKTKVFLKQTAYLQLESDLKTCQRLSATLISANVRSYLTRRRYQIICRSLRLIQNNMRVWLAKMGLYYHRVARIIQTKYRCYQAQTQLYFRHHAQQCLCQIIRRWAQNRIESRRVINKFIRLCIHNTRHQAALTLTRWFTKIIIKTQCHKRQLTLTTPYPNQIREGNDMSHADDESHLVREREMWSRQKLQQVKNNQMDECKYRDKERKYQSEIHTLQQKLQVLGNVHQSSEQQTLTLQENITLMEEREQRSQNSKMYILREMEEVVGENDKIRKELELYRKQYTKSGDNCVVQ